jgi:hypothetical protein
MATSTFTHFDQTRIGKNRRAGNRSSREKAILSAEKLFTGSSPAALWRGR